MRLFTDRIHQPKKVYCKLILGVMNHGIQNFNYQEKICLNIEIDDAKSMLKCVLHT